MNLMAASLPIFLIIILGFMVARFHLLDKNASDLIAKLVFLVVMPVTLFQDIAQLPIDKTIQWPYMLAYIASSILLILISALISRCFFKRQTPALILNAMAATQTNTAFLALPIFLILFHTIEPVASIIIIQAILVFLYSAGLELSTQKSDKRLIIQVLSIFIKNPILIGTFLGLAFSYFNWTISLIILPSLTLIKQASAFLALFALGLSLHADRQKLQASDKAEVTLLVVFKCFAHPVIAYCFGHYLFGLSGFSLTALTLMASMPTAKLTFIFAKRYQTGPERLNLAVVCSTVISVVMLNVVVGLI